MGKPYNQPSDMWALGVILFELLTLKRPFTGANIGALVLRISQGSYDDAALGACPHPPELQWLASADATLHPDPEARYTLPQLMAHHHTRCGN